MFKTICVGNLGADCVTKEENGKKFTTFRVAHSERWTDAAGSQHESTQWIDCIMNDRPKVCDYLLKGTTVYVSGNTRLRCYSSEKARGFVAGVTIQVQSIELIGGKSDPVPARLYDSAGVMHDVIKFYHVDPTALSQPILMNQQGKQFAVDDNGWVLPMEQVQNVAEPGQTESQQS